MGRAEPRISDIDIQKQHDIMELVSRFHQDRPAAPLAYVDTYGCQQNEADSEFLRGMLNKMGYTLTNTEHGADVVVINTCAVRENAENRVFGNIGALVHSKKARKSQIIAVCGCMAGRDGIAEKIRNSYKHVDLVFPPETLWRFPELLHEVITGRQRVFCLPEGGGAIAEGLPLLRDGTVKAWLSVMYGCNNFCSYCIVPYVRGRERSRLPEYILKSARGLIDEGYKDITLLGQNVNSYGFDFENSMDFPKLLREISAIDGDFLIRFMTSHPKDASSGLFRAMAESEKAAHHIHLPFQAGNDRILNLMNRGYTAAEYLKKVESARSFMPDIVITSDVIVGFPGETDEEFEDTLNLVKHARFDALFTFIYSKRPGTPAADLRDDVTRAEKQVRFDKLTELQNSISEEKNRAGIGKTMRVLVDGISPDELYPLRARTNGGRLVHLPKADYMDEFIEVRITHVNSWSLFGEFI